MKKLLAGIAVAALVVSVISVTAFAARAGHGRHSIGIGKDSICNYHNTSCPFADDNGDGICDNCGLSMHKTGAGCVDADGDGICDNYTTDKPQNGSGFQRGHCRRQGGCCN